MLVYNDLNNKLYICIATLFKFYMWFRRPLGTKQAMEGVVKSFTDTSNNPNLYNRIHAPIKLEN